MELTVAQIAELSGDLPAGNTQAVIKGAAPLELALPEQISFLANAAKLDLLKDCKAGCVIVPLALKGKELPYGGGVVYAKNPQYAFTLVLRQLHLEMKPKMPWGIHPTAVVDPTARIGKYASVGAHAVVEKEAEVGEFTVLYPHCYVGHKTQVGKNCVFYPGVVVRENCVVKDRVIIHSGTVIGADGFGYLQVDGRHEKIPQLGRVVIEEDVEIGALSAVDRAALAETRIGAGTKIDNMVQIAHNVNIGKACIIVAQAGIAGSCSLGDGVVVAGQAGIVDHIKVGNRAVIAAGTGIMKDVPEGAVMFGAPGRPHHEALKIQAILGKLPELYKLLLAMKSKLGMG